MAITNKQYQELIVMINNLTDRVQSLEDSRYYDEEQMNFLLLNIPGLIEKMNEKEEET